MQQNDFSGGLNLAVEPTKIGDTQYHLLINGRTRYGVIRPVQLPVQLTTGLPGSGTIQGLYGLDRYLLVFVDGYAYYRDMVNDNTFTNVPDFSMQGGAEIYAIPVPASSLNYIREEGRVNLATSISGTPVCILCQDGINQPWKIYPDGTAKVTRSYTEWVKDTNPEYVPIGTQMLFNSYLNKLFILGKDNNNRYTQILQSVSGRPLDFMINVDSNGEKPPSESIGGASSLAYSVGFSEITTLESVGAQDGAFFVGTLGASYLVTPRLDDLIFGEPKYRSEVFLSTGPTDTQALADINGDVAFIDQTGIKSFNSIRQQNNESNSNPFSAVVANLFENLTQNLCAAINYDNYALFAVQSVYGPCILVYDLNTKVFVALDIYPGVAQILQFAGIKIEGSKYLFFRTVDNKIYQAFVGDFATCKLYAGEWCSDNAKVGQKVDKLGLTFSKVNESGTVTTTIYMDSVAGISRQQNIVASGMDNTIPRQLPYPSAATKETSPLVFDFKDSATGYKVGFWLEWNCDASLSNILVEGNADTSQVPANQKNNATYTPTI